MDLRFVDLQICGSDSGGRSKRQGRPPRALRGPPSQGGHGLAGRRQGELLGRLGVGVGFFPVFDGSNKECGNGMAQQLL